MNKEEIEKTFRSSNNSDELFDAFQEAIAQQIDDVELYKILLGNPILADEEIGMYTEKLCNEFSGESFDLYLWTAGLFETKTYKVECLEKALYYYTKAAQIKPASYIPYLNAMNIYNYDINFSMNKEIIDFVEKNIGNVDKKSIIYKALAEHYKKLGYKSKEHEYLRLSEKSAK